MTHRGKLLRLLQPFWSPKGLGDLLASSFQCVERNLWVLGMREQNVISKRDAATF